MGKCEVPGLTLLDGTISEGIVCDIPWQGLPHDVKQKPCANWKDSQFAVSFCVSFSCLIENTSRIVLTNGDSASMTEILASSTIFLRIRPLLLRTVSGQAPSSTELWLRECGKDGSLMSSLWRSSGGNTTVVAYLERDRAAILRRFVRVAISWSCLSMFRIGAVTALNDNRSSLYTPYCT